MDVYQDTLKIFVIVTTVNGATLVDQYGNASAFGSLRAAMNFANSFGREIRWF